ncbi:hypothetical protein RchiOBHm_Chr6g0270511 [Rosa chinensis]|uniref:Uncharacterized protein n=1 Tax=Rosa chinensis TaxID=74649 RepID=A0A2P6PQQ3_ROSCH|nr:hypothetical protein RchiOBHm_Chr6g0270511 [Rosa chinensis]
MGMFSDAFSIQNNYLLNHTEVRLENVHISPVDRHILVLEECRRIWSGLRVGIVFRRLSVPYQFGVNSSVVVCYLDIGCVLLLIE